MYKFEDENLIIGRIFGVLEEAEEMEFSRRLARSQEFHILYSQTLAALRPLLCSRNDVVWDHQARIEVQGLAERTLKSLKEMTKNQNTLEVQGLSSMVVERVVIDDAEATQDTVLGVVQETLGGKLKDRLMKDAPAVENCEENLYR
ncbi:MAG: hypothetical protein Q4C70_14225 [Planctomycetia bacterium]|nr:hypothetical protein [Planctomycetia bacterium]